MKPPASTSAPEIDLHAFARIGAELRLWQLQDEAQRILALLPELRTTTPTPTEQPTHTCATCGTGFTPDRAHQKQRTCGRLACVKAYKRKYMQAYWAKRNGHQEAP